MAPGEESYVKSCKNEAGVRNRANEEAKKKADVSMTVVLKLDLHCEGCAMKLTRSIKGFEGVEAVTADRCSSELTVVGMIDPWELRDKVESKSGKTVFFVSPDILNNTSPPENFAKKKIDDSKPIAPAASTVALKIRLHCRGCIQRIRRCISKIDGVEDISFDWNEDMVTVSGTMDSEALPELLRRKLRRSVEMAPSKKDEEKKDERRADTGELRGYGYGKQLYGYRFEPVPHPFFFSDEDPNACSVM